MRAVQRAYLVSLSQSQKCKANRLFIEETAIVVTHIIPSFGVPQIRQFVAVKLYQLGFRRVTAPNDKPNISCITTLAMVM
jgi:hypothetical protein